jgi:dipeptidase E
MPGNRILAFSSSRTGSGAYLQAAAPVIKTFLGDGPLQIVFIPFASVANDYSNYLHMVQTGLADTPYIINLIDTKNPKKSITDCDVIMVGGGNTFKLLHNIYQHQLLDVIRDKVNAGTPYIGWSAGANITGPTIGTTNDMPIIEPKSFNALGLFPFQINPHYVNLVVEGHNGETRDQRLQEYGFANPGVAIVCLPEGTALKMDEGTLTFIGEKPGVLMMSEEPETMLVKKEIAINEVLTHLL